MTTPAPAAPATHLLAGEPPVAVALRRSGRARRLSLRVSGDGRVTLTYPPRVALREALAFLESREGWVRGHLAGVEGPVVPGFGAAVPFEGGELRLEPAPGLRTLREGEALLVPSDRMAARLGAWLRVQARGRLIAASDRHAAALGVGYAALTLRDPRSRWGSCSASGRLMYSWRLVMAPPHVLDYVAAHEVAHLVRLDHSPAFWAVVGRLCPTWPASRDWLRAHGAGLHRLRVE